ncbi:MAG: GAF domain-containing protein [Chloroflexi bacterium]|nr:GAF domain-containing protein [Chloroflexota bacterium]
MSALELITLVNQALFVGLFLVVLAHAVRRPSRATVDTALLFGSIAAAVAVSVGATAVGLSDAAPRTPIVLLLFNLAPYAMIRLVDDFSGTPRFMLHLGAVAYVVIAALGFAFTVQRELVQLAIIAWFLAVGGYAAFAFAWESRRTRGITRRRMRAVATGAVAFITAVVLLFLNGMFSMDGVILDIAAQLTALTAVVAFFVGFAPPEWVRRAWREPDLRRFLEQSTRLVSVADETAAMAELQRAAAAAAGADGASIGVADPRRGVLAYISRDGERVEYPDDQFIAGRAFQEQRRIVAIDATALDPANAARYEQSRARTVIAAPITRGDRRIGVLAVYADRAPIFVEDDLWLIELLADHTSILLEARDLARQTGLLEAREEAARLKEEFLSAAAHDLRTPLTVVLGQAELLERRTARNPAAPVDAAGVSRLTKEARRLRDLISEMLDAQRLEQGVTMDRRTTDLRSIVTTVLERHAEEMSAVAVHLPDEVLSATVDGPRMQQVIENLLDNARKYSPDTATEIRLWREGDEARIAVVDRGVGVPDAERERIFERFYRASNARDITDTGMGLGLYICRRIVEEHGGLIWAEPTPGGGTTFVVALAGSTPPASLPEQAEPAHWAPAGDGTEAVADA